MSTLDIVKAAEKAGIISAPCTITWTQLQKFAKELERIIKSNK